MRPQPLPERTDAPSRVIHASHQHTNASHPFRALRTRDEGPCSCTGEHRDDFAAGSFDDLVGAHEQGRWNG